MTNPLRGEAALTLDGKDYTLVFDFNAMCALEEATGRSADLVMENFSAAGTQKGASVPMRDLRALLWSALQERHPEVSLTEAGRLFGTDPGAVSAAVAKAIAAAMPDPKDVPKGGHKRPPAKAARG